MYVQATATLTTGQNIAYSCLFSACSSPRNFLTNVFLRIFSSLQQSPQITELMYALVLVRATLYSPFSCFEPVLSPNRSRVACTWSRTLWQIYKRDTLRKESCLTSMLMSATRSECSTPRVEVAFGFALLYFRRCSFQEQFALPPLPLERARSKVRTPWRSAGLSCAVPPRQGSTSLPAQALAFPSRW